MAVKTQAQIDAEITALITDNSTKDITAAKLRTVLRDINDSYGNLSSSAKIYEALLSQAPPTTNETGGTLTVGRIYTVSTYDAGDDFSAQELISGTVNTTGCVIRALVGIGWTNSQLTYDGAPYIVSTDSNDDFNPFINSLSGSPAFTYDAVGEFTGTLAAAFPKDKTTIEFIGGFPAFIYTGQWNNVNSFKLYVQDGGGASNDGRIFYSLLRIKVNS